MGDCPLIRSHPAPAPGSRDVPGNECWCTAVRQRVCRPSGSTSPPSGVRSAGTSSFSPSLALLTAAIKEKVLEVSAEHRICDVHPAHPVIRVATFFAAAGKDRLSSLLVS